MKFIVSAADGSEKRVIGKREADRLRGASRLMVTISRHVEEELSRQLIVGSVGIAAFLESGSVEDDSADDVTDDATAATQPPGFPSQVFA